MVFLVVTRSSNGVVARDAIKADIRLACMAKPPLAMSRSAAPITLPPVGVMAGPAPAVRANDHVVGW